MKKTRIFPKLMAFAMGVTLLLPVAGCAGGGETAKIDPDDVDIWAASNTQKIFQDSLFDAFFYCAFYSAAKIHDLCVGSYPVRVF